MTEPCEPRAPEPHDPSDLDAIADALSRLRGGRRPPFGGPGGFGPGGHGPFGGPPWARHTHGARDGGHGPHGWAPGGPGRMGGLARLRLLEALAAASHALSVGEIGEAIGVDQPRASRLIQQAADLGWVQREADPDDARRTRVALTAAGEQVAHGMRGERRAKLGTALSDFTDAERAELARLLAKLADAWPRDAPPDAASPDTASADG